MPKNVFLLVFVLLGVAMAAFAQQDKSKQAAEALADGNYPRAITLYEEITEGDAHNANSWERLGLSYLLGGKYSLAVPALERALQEGFRGQSGKYNLACAYARLGRKDDSIRLLTDLAEQGWPGVAQIGSDNDLQSLRDDPRFVSLAEQAKLAAEPCRDPHKHPEFRQLDFWVGEWDVFSGTQKVGDSSIQLILKDCVVLENWTAVATGSAGKSFNKYDPVNKYWQQFWVEDDGTTTLFTGHLENGEMRYNTEGPGPNGEKIMQHLTFSKLGPDKVRQFKEISSDGGKTWNVGYDFTYIRKK
jgi:hypothetical protein